LRRRSGDHSYYFISSYIGEHITFHAARLRAHAKALRAEAAKAAPPASPMSVVDPPAAPHDLKPIVCKAMVAHAPKQPLVCEMVSEKKKRKKKEKKKEA